MGMFYWYANKKDKNWWTLVALTLLAIFFIWKSIIESGHLWFYIICVVWGVALYFFINFLQKHKISKPASLWRVYSKKYPIVVQYFPPKWINPAEAWLLYNCSVEPTDLTSLIYQWKFEKLIDIKTFKWENSNKEYIKLIKLKDMPLTRPLFESGIFDSIFCMWDIKIIEWSFQLRYALMLEDLEFHWIQKWWLVTNKKKNNISSMSTVKWVNWFETTYFLMFFFVLIFSIIMESLGVTDGIFDNVSICFSEFIWILFIVVWIVIITVLIYWKSDWGSKLKFTDKWAELASKVIWYSQFIKSCDENRIKLFLKEDPLFIDRTLPYATAFWMETEFLKKISPLKKDWNARYYNWQKIPVWIGALRFLMRDDNSWF